MLKGFDKLVCYITVQGMSLTKVSYEAFIFSVFLRNRGKTKPLTWRSVSSLSLPPAQPGCPKSHSIWTQAHGNST